MVTLDGATEIRARSCEHEAASLRTLTGSVKVQRSGKGRVLGFSSFVNNGFHKLVNVQAVVSACVSVLSGRAAVGAAVCEGSSARASPRERATGGGEKPAEQIASSGATVHH